mgnify:FL=1
MESEEGARVGERKRGVGVGRESGKAGEAAGSGPHLSGKKKGLGTAAGVLVGEEGVAVRSLLEHVRVCHGISQVVRLRPNQEPEREDFDGAIGFIDILSLIHI